MYLVEYETKYKEDVENYFLTDEMKYYTGAPQDNIIISEKNPKHHSILAYSETNLVTFFVLDEDSDKLTYTNEPQSMLLRSFSTDSRYVRQGHAKESLRLLPDFVKATYPEIKEIVLAVNIKNESAQNLYKQVGFVDKGVRRNGKKGELIVLSYDI
ncbi:GNAT family N-acetyltransferase [Clostridium sp. D2Q-14]|uniref:GNAT family N-acetyltransferase n=1 Tax=Anaeromonas gelatinilytica TaxID=2683194 RepID=UPI00193C3417|nr:GNAT family N-acetyltransferase [Anaeromonas gelatinilytica]MBS4534079.1 GNAT family N-acetyltransferase [Anaeromonas gelatinilytica]